MDDPLAYKKSQTYDYNGYFSSYIEPSFTLTSPNLVKINASKDHITLVAPETDHHQSSIISRVSSSTPSTVSKVENTEPDNYSIRSTSSHISNQCQEQMQLLFDMCPVINKNYVNTQYLSNALDLINIQQYRKMKEYSKGLKPEQLFRCPKDPRPKRRKCCGGKLPRLCKLTINI